MSKIIREDEENIKAITVPIIRNASYIDTFQHPRVCVRSPICNHCLLPQPTWDSSGFAGLLRGALCYHVGFRTLVHDVICSGLTYIRVLT